MWKTTFIKLNIHIKLYMGTKAITITEDAYKNESMTVNDLAHMKRIHTRTVN